MTVSTNGGPAFPMMANEYSGTGPEWGMSLRDYFAAKAMQALISKHGACYPADAYEVADAMLAARNDHE